MPAASCVFDIAVFGEISENKKESLYTAAERHFPSQTMKRMCL